jgi:hypothetical protein
MTSIVSTVAKRHLALADEDFAINEMDNFTSTSWAFDPIEELQKEYTIDDELMPFLIRNVYGVHPTNDSDVPQKPEVKKVPDSPFRDNKNAARDFNWRRAPIRTAQNDQAHGTIPVPKPRQFTPVYDTDPQSRIRPDQAHGLIPVPKPRQFTPVYDTDPQSRIRPDHAYGRIPGSRPHYYEPTIVSRPRSNETASVPRPPKNNQSYNATPVPRPRQNESAVHGVGNTIKPYQRNSNSGSTSAQRPPRNEHNPIASSGKTSRQNPAPKALPQQHPPVEIKVQENEVKEPRSWAAVASRNQK